LEIFEIRALYAIVLIQILHYKVLFFFLKFLSSKLNKRVCDAFYDRGYKDEAEKHYRQCIEITSQMTLDVIQVRFELYKEIIVKNNPHSYFKSLKMFQTLLK
jgi:hypothetical protein